MAPRSVHINSMMQFSFLILFLLAEFTTSQQQKRCYWPDGSISPKDVPCDPDAEVSACCEGGGRSACMSNGYCLWLDDGTLDRNSCTDQEWGPPCAQQCSNATGSPSSNNHANLVSCGLQNYCCDDVYECCTNGQTFALQPFTISGPPDFLRSIALNATSSTTTSPSSSSTASPSSSASSCPSSSSTGKEAAIGAGVGVPLGLALLISTLLFLREHRLRKRDTAQDSSIPPHSLPMSPHPYSISGTHELPFSDGGSTKRPDSEMAHAPAPRQKPPVELGDNNNAG